MKRPSRTLLLIAAALIFTACSKDQPKELEKPMITNMANPAAVYCVEQGGEYNLQDSRCTLADGSVVNAWDYYYAHHPKDSDKQNDSVNIANPAAVYCAKHGRYDLKTGKCHLDNGDVIDAWEYFRAHHK